uniref:E3 ubiquitin-protein ligase RNF138 n=1 Tax=Equus caballus TaxID=9796 RepID=A0A9L0TAG1_HORSE
MAEELSAATSYTEDDFYCPVCQEVLKTPVRTAACQHVFCRKCFLTAMRESGIHCPLCRGNVTRRERACPERALDLENIMRKFSGSCRCCAKQIKFYRMRHHYKSCKKYQDEYGVSSIIPNFQISQDSVGNRRMANMHMCDLKSSDKANTQLPTNQVKKWDIFQDLRISLSAHAHLNPILPEVTTVPDTKRNDTEVILPIGPQKKKPCSKHPLSCGKYRTSYIGLYFKDLQCRLSSCLIAVYESLSSRGFSLTF